MRQQFNYTGTVQHFTVPDQVYSIQVEAWGATGGGTTETDAGVGYVRGTLAVFPGDVLSIYAGKRGAPPSASTTPATFGGGGPGGTCAGTSTFRAFGGSGGGSSDVRHLGGGIPDRLAVAGGSGGAGAGGTHTQPVAAKRGGAGGPATGGTALGNSLSGSAGKGGTQSAGGAGGTGGTNYPGGVDGALQTGGRGGNAGAGSNSYGGGGAGGGYYGGGGGDATTASDTGAGGGGGSNYIGGLTSAVSQTVKAWQMPYGPESPTGPVTPINGTSHDGFVVLTMKVPPDAPTPVSPAGGNAIDVSVPTTFTWNYSQVDNVPQSVAMIQWRTSGGAWNPYYNISSDATTSGDTPANTFATALGQQVEWQVRTTSRDGLISDWSPSAFFVVQATVATPAIVTPADGSTIASGSADVTWTHPGYNAYQVRRVADLAGVADPGTVYFDTGQVNDNTTSTVNIPFDINPNTEHVQVSVKVNAAGATGPSAPGIWSNWADARVNVAYQVPMTPAIRVVGDSSNQTATIFVTNPAPVGGSPAVAEQDIYATYKGVTIRIATLPATYVFPFVYQYAMPGMTFHATAVSVLGTLANSPESAPLDNRLSGVWLLDPTDPAGTRLWIQLNDTGAAETYDIETATAHYAGRTLPVVDFGEAENDQVSVNITHLDEDGTADRLRALVKRKAVLLYRDKKGRKVWGTVSTHPLTDAYSFQTSQLVVNAVDYDESE